MQVRTRANLDAATDAGAAQMMSVHNREPLNRYQRVRETVGTGSESEHRPFARRNYFTNAGRGVNEERHASRTCAGADQRKLLFLNRDVLRLASRGYIDDVTTGRIIHRRLDRSVRTSRAHVNIPGTGDVR